MLDVNVAGDCRANTYDAVIGGDLRATGPTINTAGKRLINRLGELGYKGIVRFHRPPVEISLGSAAVREVQI